MHPFAAIFAVLGLAGSGAAVPLAAAGGLDSTDWVGPEIPTGFVLGDPGNIFTHGRCSVFARVYVNIKDGFTKSAFVRVRDSTDVPFAEVKFWGPRGVVWGGGMPDYLQITVLQGNVMDFRYGDQYWHAEMPQCKYSTVKGEPKKKDKKNKERWRDLVCSFDC